MSHAFSESCDKDCEQFRIGLLQHENSAISELE